MEGVPPEARGSEAPAVAADVVLRAEELPNVLADVAAWRAGTGERPATGWPPM